MKLNAAGALGWEDAAALRQIAPSAEESLAVRALLEELQLDLGHVSIGLVCLGQRDDDRHARRPRSIDRLDSLLLDSVIGRDSEDHLIG